MVIIFHVLLLHYFLYYSSQDSGTLSCYKIILASQCLLNEINRSIVVPLFMVHYTKQVQGVRLTWIGV